MSTEFASEKLTKQMSVNVKKLGGRNKAIKFSHDKLSVLEPIHKWFEQDSIIYLDVISDGTTGPGWIKRLEKRGCRLSCNVKSMLLSTKFKPTKDVMTKITILKGNLFNDDNYTVFGLNDLAIKHNLSKPNAEVACLIRENFSNEDLEAMGLIWIAIMHEPVNDFEGNSGILRVSRYRNDCWLNAYYVGPDSGRFKGRGFAFIS